jgi:HPt (histidine-containing phosphotransfer) domain-containing protein
MPVPPFAESPTAAGPYFDQAKGVGMMGSAASLKMILKTVLDTMVGNLPEIEAALHAGDVKKANAMLHAIKGYVPIFASDALVAQVTHVEKVSKTESAAVVLPLYEGLSPQLHGLLAEIRVFLAQND